MTQEQQDAVWRALPKKAKEKAREEFRRHEGCNSSTGNDFCCGYVGALIHFFGKHNLTATEEEEKPKFKVGDCVKVCISNNSVYRKGDVCLVMSVIKDLSLIHI